MRFDSAPFVFVSFLLIAPAVFTDEAVGHQVAEIFFEVLESREVEVDGGARKVVFKRVAPPELPESQVEPERVEAREWTEQERAAMEEWTAKESVSLLIEAVKYEPGVTRIGWGHGGNRVVAWSNVDFSVFPAFGQVETDSLRLTYMILASRASDGGPAVPGWQPDADDFDPERADWFVVAPESGEIGDGDLALRGIEALHDFYDRNRQELHVAHAGREAARILREQEQAENPPQPRDTTIHYWPVESRLHR